MVPCGQRYRSVGRRPTLHFPWPAPRGVGWAWGGGGGGALPPHPPSPPPVSVTAPTLAQQGPPQPTTRGEKGGRDWRAPALSVRLTIFGKLGHTSRPLAEAPREYLTNGSALLTARLTPQGPSENWRLSRSAGHFGLRTQAIERRYPLWKWYSGPGHMSRWNVDACTRLFSRLLQSAGHHTQRLGSHCPEGRSNST